MKSQYLTREARHAGIYARRALLPREWGKDGSVSSGDSGYIEDKWLKDREDGKSLTLLLWLLLLLLRQCTNTTQSVISK